MALAYAPDRGLARFRSVEGRGEFENGRPPGPWLRRLLGRGETSMDPARLSIASVWGIRVFDASQRHGHGGLELQNSPVSVPTLGRSAKRKPHRLQPAGLRFLCWSKG